ncbi:MAG: hypothetical protein P4L80_19405 [Xanthobacteraceae bacterium]|nr:hypothetical protein [Xanthobacteraceae bacterium]
MHQFAGKRAGKRDFEAVEDPSDAECNDHKKMEAAKLQRIEPIENIGLDDAAGSRLRCAGTRRCAQTAEMWRGKAATEIRAARCPGVHIEP